MNKKLLFGVFLFGMVFAVGLAIAEDPVSVLTEEGVGVSASVGTVDLPEGTRMGGDPTNFVTLSQGIYLETANGLEYFESGTKIDCDDIPPGEQDPCDPY